MKNNLTIILAIFFCNMSLISFGQHGHDHEKCGTHLTAEENSVYFEKVNQMKSRRKGSLKSDAQYVIPVVFHILTDPGISQEDMKCRIDDAIQLMNDDFNGLNPDFATTDPIFNNIKATMSVEFCAAKIDPSGNPLAYPGMDWQTQAGITYGYAAGIDSYAWFGQNEKYYMDVLVVSFPNSNDGSVTQSGHAFLPTQNVVPSIKYNYRYIGRTCGSWSDDGFGSVMTHEVGHYLGLRHIWGTGATSACNDDDGIADTPNTSGSEGCGQNVTTSCPGGGNYNAENYMDYNTSCYAMFTQGQVDLMTGWLVDMQDAFYPRGNLWQSANLVATGCVDSLEPVAGFSASATRIFQGSSVDFTDNSAGDPTTWSWTFEGGSPSTSSAQNPTVTYSTPGTFQVELTVTNAQGSGAVTKVDFIEVLASGTQVCDELSNTLAGHSRVTNGITGQWGFIGGHNGYGDLTKVEVFPAPSLPNTSIIGTDIWFARADAGSNNSTIDVKVWDGTGGVPGNELASKTIAVNTLGTSDYTSIDFDTPVSVSDQYFVGVELTYGNGDTVVVFLNSNGESTPGTAWEKWSDGKWYAFSNEDSWGWNVSHYIKVRICSTDKTTDILSNVENDAIVIFPNPSNGVFNVNFANDYVYTIDVQNSIGQSVFNVRTGGERAINIDLSAQENGIYFVNILSENRKITKKIIKK